MKKCPFCVIALIALGLLLGCSTIPPSTQVPPPIEVILAQLQKGIGTSESDPLVKRFRMLLDNLDPKFVEDRKAIADLTVKAQQLLKENAINEPLDRIMEGVNTAMYAKVANQNYAEYAAAYLTLRQQGQSHDAAVNGLKALIQSLGVK
jgi:hypothetical protein